MSDSSINMARGTGAVPQMPIDTFSAGNYECAISGLDPNGSNNGNNNNNAIDTISSIVADNRITSDALLIVSDECGEKANSIVIGSCKLSRESLEREYTLDSNIETTAIAIATATSAYGQDDYNKRMRRSDIESPVNAPQATSTVGERLQKQDGGSGRLLGHKDARLSPTNDLNCRPPTSSLDIRADGVKPTSAYGDQRRQQQQPEQRQPEQQGICPNARTNIEWTAVSSVGDRAARFSGGSRSLNIKTDLVRPSCCSEKQHLYRGHLVKTIKSLVGNLNISNISTSTKKTLFSLVRWKADDFNSCNSDEVESFSADKLCPKDETYRPSADSCVIDESTSCEVKKSYSCHLMLKQQQQQDHIAKGTSSRKELSVRGTEEIEDISMNVPKSKVDERSFSSSNINNSPSATNLATASSSKPIACVGPLARNKYIIEDKLRKQNQIRCNAGDFKTSSAAITAAGHEAKTNTAADQKRSTYCSSSENAATVGTSDIINYDSSSSSVNNYSESNNTSAMIRQYSRDSSENQANDNFNSNKSPTSSSRNQSSVIIDSRKQPRGGGLISNQLKKRENWDKNIEFLLAVIGFAVDLGNVWRFPYICYKNGGGAFLIPYTIMFILGGLPIFYLEMSLGQYFSSGCLTVWRRVCPLAKGIGYAMCILNFYTGLFYNTIISWAVFFFVESFTDVLPWTNCNNTWNSANCLTLEQRKLYNLNNTSMMTVVNGLTTNSSLINSTSPTKDYLDREILQINRSAGIHDLGSIRKPLAIYLAIVFICIYFAIWKGVKSTGKAVWITALLPYFVLIPLLIRGVFLEGAWLGLKYYLYPDWNKIADLKVWVAAAQQIYFSLGPGFGTLMALSSYNKFNHNCRRDALIAATVNYFASFISGLVIFAVLGYMATLGNVNINDVATDGPGLVFQVYPEGLATMRFSPVWSVLFFTMVITLGIDSTFGGLESVITGLCDDYPRVLRANRGIFIGVLIILIYICSLPTTTYGGNYVIILIEAYGTTLSLLFIVLIETIIVCWVYGADRFCKNLEEMTGQRPGTYWRICWKYISPTILSVIFIAACGEEFQKYSTLRADGYIYPAWAPKIGLLMTGSSICCIPIYAIYYIKTKTSGSSFFERLKVACRPIEGDHQNEIYVDALTDKIKDEKDSHLSWQVQEAPSSII